MHTQPVLSGAYQPPRAIADAPISVAPVHDDLRVGPTIGEGMVLNSGMAGKRGVANRVDTPRFSFDEGPGIGAQTRQRLVEAPGYERVGVRAHVGVPV